MREISRIDNAGTIRFVVAFSFVLFASKSYKYSKFSNINFQQSSTIIARRRINLSVNKTTFPEKKKNSNNINENHGFFVFFFSSRRIYRSQQY